MGIEEYIRLMHGSGRTDTCLGKIMTNEVKEVEILLVEDNPTDAELTIRALKKSTLNVSYREI
jgi:pyrimidine deaminase RibD-like protein